MHCWFFLSILFHSIIVHSPRSSLLLLRVERWQRPPPKFPRVTCPYSKFITPFVIFTHNFERNHSQFLRLIALCFYCHYPQFLRFIALIFYAVCGVNLYLYFFDILKWIYKSLYIYKQLLFLFFKSIYIIIIIKLVNLKKST